MASSKQSFLMVFGFRTVSVCEVSHLLFNLRFYASLFILIHNLLFIFFLLGENDYRLLAFMLLKVVWFSSLGIRRFLGPVLLFLALWKLNISLWLVCKQNCCINWVIKSNLVYFDAVFVLCLIEPNYFWRF